MFLAVEINEKGHTDRDIIFEEKRQKALEKELGCKFIRINTSNAKNGYDLVIYKHLLVSSKIKKIEKLENQLIKEKEMREKLAKQSIKKKEMREKLEVRKKNRK